MMRKLSIFRSAETAHNTARNSANCNAGSSSAWSCLYFHHCGKSWYRSAKINAVPAPPSYLLFGMILNLDIGLLHPSRLPRHKISQKKWKRPKKFFEGRTKDQIEKKRIFITFFALIWSHGLENSANVFGLTFKAIKTKKGHKKAEYS